VGEMAKNVILFAATAAMITIKKSGRQCDGRRGNNHGARKICQNTNSVIEKIYQTKKSSKQLVRVEIIHYTVLLLVPKF
jgi:hypothetical protein